ncbi:protein rapunzel-like [Protopterus annectens]|uniref:protein rapunzel-like n=1 Tax=Protopterus annectens TaxID=7888 RepID=UPI001CFA5E43|nr:protein rapunzel-like [Protopterus annectens]
MSEDEQALENFKKGVKCALECVAGLCSAAAVINPIFGLAGSLIKVVSHTIDVEEAGDLKRGFEMVNESLDKISNENKKILNRIPKETADNQLYYIEKQIKSQFRAYMEVIEAEPEERERKKQTFVKSYVRDGAERHLHTLYDSVMGRPKIFSDPILKVYLECSKMDRKVMKSLCDHLKHLFCIGLIAYMGYVAVREDDEETLCNRWKNKMEMAWGKMDDALKKCY